MVKNPGPAARWTERRDKGIISATRSQSGDKGAPGCEMMEGDTDDG